MSWPRVAVHQMWTTELHAQQIWARNACYARYICRFAEEGLLYRKWQTISTVGDVPAVSALVALRLLGGKS